MNNNILKLATITAKIIRAMIVFLGGLLIVFMICYPMNPDWFENFRVIQSDGVFEFTTDKDSEGLSFTEYGTVYLYFALVKALFVTIALFFVLNTALRIIHSIKDLKTFRKENVESFRKMGFLFLIMMILNLTTIKEVAGEVTLTAQILFNYAVYALICFVLAEIFKEGNRLHEENQLTI